MSLSSLFIMKKKNMLNVVIRSVATILIGVLLITQREAIMPIIVQCIGVAFVLPGIIALLSHFFNNKEAGGQKVGGVVLLTSVGSLVFGLWLLLMPSFFVGILMMLLGGILTLFGVYQIAALVIARRIAPVPLYMYIMPIVLVALGCVVLFNPFGAASMPFLLVGIGAVVGGLSDLVNSIFVEYGRRKKEKADAVVISIDAPLDDR